MSTTNNEYEAYYDAAAATQHKDQTLPVLFLCLMLLLALVLLLGRALQNRPKLNAYLSEPALIVLVSACCSIGIKVMFGGGGSGSSSNSNSASSNDDAYVSDNNNNNNDNDGYYDYDNDNGNNNNNNNNSYAVMNTINENHLFSLLLTFSGELFFMVFLPPVRILIIILPFVSYNSYCSFHSAVILVELTSFLFLSYILTLIILTQSITNSSTNTTTDVRI